MVEVESQEVALRVAKRRLHTAQLQDVSWMGGREAQGLAAVDDVFTQT